MIIKVPSEKLGTFFVVGHWRRRFVSTTARRRDLSSFNGTLSATSLLVSLIQGDNSFFIFLP